MIVPRTRFLFWVGLIVLPFAVLGGVEPAVRSGCLVIIGLLALFAVIDAIRGLRESGDITIELPGIVRLSKDRTGAIEIRIKNDRTGRRSFRLGLALPPTIRSEQDDLEIALAAGLLWSRVIWRCRPVERGTYFIHKAYLETSSPFGFWAVRSATPSQAEIRVYPNLHNERKNLAALFLNRGRYGMHAQRQVGKGRDFEKLRDYIPGDSFEDIHWKATAKRGHPVTKVFQIERTQEVYVIIDHSRLSQRRVGPAQEKREPACGRVTAAGPGVPGSNVLEQFLSSALVLALAAEQQGDLFGLVTFADKVRHFVRAGNGGAHYDTCRDALFVLQPKIVSPDFDEVYTFIRLRLRRRALVIFLTGLDDPILAESFVQNMDLICRQHVVLVNMIRPPGIDPVFSDPNINTLDEIYERLGGHLQWQKLRQLGKVLQRRGVRFSLLPYERMSAELISQYLSVKQRQLL